MSNPVWLADPRSESSPELVGNKALNLAKLIELGFNVPPCLFITTLGSPAAEFATAADYLDAIESFSTALSTALPSKAGWAVRSSATVEDMPGESHAGRFETLFIESGAELRDAVEAVWDSGRTADLGPESMGVVLQVLVDADFAGVAFSHDPTKSAGGTVIEGVPGNAARFVDGELTPFRIRPVADEMLLPTGFSDALVGELDAGVQRLADKLELSVDTEWAIDDGTLYWLQVRPLTGAAATEFTLSDEDKAALKGLWVRINHSFAPQAALVATMNAGGYFDGPGWRSQLVNGFHYIQEDKRDGEPLEPEAFDAILDEWDNWEQEFEALYEPRIAVDLDNIECALLWDEIEQRVDLSQQYFTHYSDRRFLAIRDQTQQKVDGFVGAAMADDPTSKIMSAKLLGQLGSLTEEKQRQLTGLAQKYAEVGEDNLRSSDEWQAFMRKFGSESPTTHMFYLPALKEQPELVIEMLGQMNHANRQAPQPDSWREVAATIADALPADEQPVFAAELARLRRCLLRTEDDDYALSRCTLLVREAYLAAGQRCVAARLIDTSEDVFHMTGDELQYALLGSRDKVRKTAVVERKLEFENNGRLSPPPMIVNGRIMQPKTEKLQTTLTGTPASPGVASGTVLVLDNPFSCAGKKLPPNAVIVAPVVTPSLAYSLMGCAAVITEIGGLASHGAIVAREMAIPAVVGVSKARAKLQTGLSVSVDGSTGEINLLGTPQ